MKALAEPEPEKDVIQPTEVWSPSMGTEPMPVAGEISQQLRCNFCGELGCPLEPKFRAAFRQYLWEDYEEGWLRRQALTYLSGVYLVKFPEEKP